MHTQKSDIRAEALSTAGLLMSAAGPRVMHAANMMLQAQQWIERTHPRAWGRRGGRDHIWLSPNDEGGLRGEL